MSDENCNFFFEQLLLQIMGCGSQKGCLGPKPRQRQVYLDLVETIYYEATTLQKSQNEDLFVCIKNHLIKKGLLRKLIDNLASHKSNIEECMQQNFKMSVSSDAIQGRMASLIIVDKIVDDCLKDKREEINKSSQENLSPFSNQILNQSAIAVHFQNDMTTDIYHRLSILFLNLIEYLFQKEIKLQKESINSLRKFLTLKNDKLLTKVEISHIFELLIANIKQNKLVEESIDSVALILSRLKQSTTNQINKDQLCFFLRQWISIDQQKREQKKNGLLKVLREYFNRAYIEYEVLNLSIITVLDEVYFSLKACLKMEELFLNFTGDKQTVKHYMKRIFVSFLKYFQSKYQNDQVFKSSLKHVDDQRSKQNLFKTLTKWIVNQYVQMNSIIEYNPSVILIFIFNIEKKSFVEGELKAQFFKIISFLNDESLLTITTLISEEMKQKILTIKNRQLFFTLFQQIFKTRQSLIQNPSNIEKVKFAVNIEKYYSRELKMKILSFTSRCLRAINVSAIKQNSQYYDIFCLQLIEFVYSIYEEIIFSFSQDEDLRSPKSPKQLGMSKGSMKELNNLIFLHRFILQVLKIFNVLKDCKLVTILISFTSHLNACLENFDPYHSQQNAVIFYFLVYIIEKNLFMMSTKQKILEQIGRTSIKLQLNQINFDHFQQIINTSRSIIKSQVSFVVLSEIEGINTPRKYQSRAKILINNNKLRIDVIQRLYMIENLELSQIDQIFKQHFRLKHTADKNNTFNQSSSNILFHRMPSIKITSDDLYSEKQSDRGEEEHSFQEILSKIKKE